MDHTAGMTDDELYDYCRLRMYLMFFLMFILVVMGAVIIWTFKDVVTWDTEIPFP